MTETQGEYISALGFWVLTTYFDFIQGWIVSNFQFKTFVSIK